MSAPRPFTGSSTARKIISSVSITICRKHAANVGHCGQESLATEHSRPAIAYRKGLISLETDRGLGTGRVTLSSSSDRLAMPMSRPSSSARAAIPFSSKTRAGIRDRSWTRSCGHSPACPPSHDRASRLIAAQSSRHSGLWKTVSARGAGSAIQARPGRKAPSKTLTSASAAFYRRTPTSARCRKQR